MSLQYSFLCFTMISILIDTCNAVCCDQLNPGVTMQGDCACSDLTGGVGTCSCTTSPNSRQGWLCVYNATNGDSVNQ